MLPLLLTLVLWTTALAGDYRIDVVVHSDETSATTITYDVSPDVIAAVQSDPLRRAKYERKGLRDFAERRGYSRKVYGKENYKLINGLYIEFIRVIGPGLDKEIYHHIHRTGSGR